MNTFRRSQQQLKKDNSELKAKQAKTFNKNLKELLDYIIYHTSSKFKSAINVEAITSWLKQAKEKDIKVDENLLEIIKNNADDAFLEEAGIC